MLIVAQNDLLEGRFQAATATLHGLHATRPVFLSAIYYIAPCWAFLVVVIFYR